MSKNRLKYLITAIMIIGILFGGCSVGKTQNSAQTQKEEVTEVVADDGVKLSNDSSDFMLLSEAVPDAILEIRYYSTYNFVGDRIDGYEQPTALMTKEAAEALKETSKDLKKQGYRLKIYDAYRPQRAVDLMVCASSSSRSMSPSWPCPFTMRFRISSMRLVPTRQGVHFPQDSSTMKSI